MQDMNVNYETILLYDDVGSQEQMRRRFFDLQWMSKVCPGGAHESMVSPKHW